MRTNKNQWGQIRNKNNKKEPNIPDKKKQEQTWTNKNQYEQIRTNKSNS